MFHFCVWYKINKVCYKNSVEQAAKLLGTPQHLPHITIKSKIESFDDAVEVYNRFRGIPVIGFEPAGKAKQTSEKMFLLHKIVDFHAIEIPMKLKTGTNLEYENGIHFSLAYGSRAFTPVEVGMAYVSNPLSPLKSEDIHLCVARCSDEDPSKWNIVYPR